MLKIKFRLNRTVFHIPRIKTAIIFVYIYNFEIPSSLASGSEGDILNSGAFGLRALVNLGKLVAS